MYENIYNAPLLQPKQSQYMVPVGKTSIHAMNGRNLFSYTGMQSLSEHVIIYTGKYKCTECSKCCYSSQKLVANAREEEGGRDSHPERVGAYVC